MVQLYIDELYDMKELDMASAVALKHHAWRRL